MYFPDSEISLVLFLLVLFVLQFILYRIRYYYYFCRGEPSKQVTVFYCLEHNFQIGRQSRVSFFPLNVHNAYFHSLFIKRLKYLNLEHNEISSIPHLRLLGARVRQDDISRQENVETVNEGGNSSLANVPEEKDEEMRAEKDGVSENKKDVKNDEVNEDANEFIMDEVDEILNQKLVGDEQNEERNRPEMKPRSSTLTEDPSLLGNYEVFFRIDWEGQLLSGAPNDGFLSDALKRYFRLSGVL